MLPLPPVPPAGGGHSPPLALMHNHFLDKLMEHGRCQFEEISIAFYKLDKLVCFQPVGVPALYLSLPFGYGRFKPGLFLVIHIVNIKTIRGVRAITNLEGYEGRNLSISKGGDQRSCF